MEALVNALKVLEVALEGRHFDLDKAAGLEIERFALGELDDKFFDKGRHVVVGYYFALPLFDREHFGRHFDLHVLLDVDLTGEPHALARLALGNVAGLGLQDIATTLVDIHLALGTGAAAAAGRRHKYLVVGQHVEQLAPCRNGESLALVVVDEDPHVAAGHQPGAGDQNYGH